MRDIIKNHIKENIKKYLVLFIFLTIGLAFGTMFINNSNETQKTQISTYINDFTKSVQTNKIDYIALLKNSTTSNLQTMCIIIFVSMSLFGTIGNYAISFYNGFSLGYTISSVIAVFGLFKGLTFAMSLILFGKIIYIPAILYLMISSSLFYKKIVSGEADNIKLETIRYAISVLIVLALLILSSLTETFISSNLFLKLINFITN